MPCTNPHHNHIWPTTGVLVIQRCETRCGFCVGAAAVKDWKHAWFTRRHAETHVKSGDFPRLLIDAGWDIQNPKGVSFNKARKKRKPSKKIRRTSSSTPSLLGGSFKDDHENDDDFQPVDSRRDSESIHQQHLEHHPYPNDHVQDFEYGPPANTYQPYQPYRTYQPHNSFAEQPFEWSDNTGHDAPMLHNNARATKDVATYSLDFENIALPSDMDPNDPIFHLCDAKDDTKATPMDKIRSANRLTAIRGVRKEPNDPFDRSDVLCMLQAIAEGKASGSDLPSAIKQYIVDTIGEKKLSSIMSGGRPSRSRAAGKRLKGPQPTKGFNDADSGSNTGARYQSSMTETKRGDSNPSHANNTSSQDVKGTLDSSSLLNQLTFVDGQAYLNGMPVLEKDNSSEQPGATRPLYNTATSATGNPSYGKPNDTTSAIESIDAVALGRMFAAQHGGSLDIKQQLDSTGGSMPFVSEFPNPLVSEYQPAKQQPTGISEYFQQIRVLEEPRTSPVRGPTMVDSAWSFPPDMAPVSSDGGNGILGGPKAKADLGSLLKPGIPTPGEMKNLFESKYDGFDKDSPGPRSFLEPNRYDKARPRRPARGPMKKIDSTVAGFEWMNDPTFTVAYNNPLCAASDQAASVNTGHQDDDPMAWRQTASGDLLGLVGDSFDNDWEFP